MHELGVVFHVIDDVKKIAQENGVSRVSSITIELGEVSTVIPFYLKDCFDWAKKKHEVLQDCELKVETIKAVTLCDDCKKEYSTIEHGKKCPYCESENTYLLRGNEFTIKEIEAE